MGPTGLPGTIFTLQKMAYKDEMKKGETSGFLVGQWRPAESISPRTKKKKKEKVPERMLKMLRGGGSGGRGEINDRFQKPKISLVMNESSRWRRVDARAWDRLSLVQRGPKRFHRGHDQFDLKMSDEPLESQITKEGNKKSGFFLSVL